MANEHYYIKHTEIGMYPTVRTMHRQGASNRTDNNPKNMIPELCVYTTQEKYRTKRLHDVINIRVLAERQTYCSRPWP